LFFAFAVKAPFRRLMSEKFLSLSFFACLKRATFYAVTNCPQVRKTLKNFQAIACRVRELQRQKTS